MLGSRVQDAFNGHINAEMFSSYLYLSMSAYFDSQNLTGMSSWMKVQAQEELTHAMKFFTFLDDRGGRVILSSIETPRSEWGSALEVFQDALEHERMVTGLVGDLAELALAERDHASSTFLQWFITEQVEEESVAQSIVDKLKIIGDNPVAIYMLDGELGQRTLAASPPSGV